MTNGQQKSYENLWWSCQSRPSLRWYSQFLGRLVAGASTAKKARIRDGALARIPPRRHAWELELAEFALYLGYDEVTGDGDLCLAAE